MRVRYNVAAFLVAILYACAMAGHRLLGICLILIVLSYGDAIFWLRRVARCDLFKLAMWRFRVPYLGGTQRSEYFNGTLCRTGSI